MREEGLGNKKEKNAGREISAGSPIIRTREWKKKREKCNTQGFRCFFPALVRPNPSTVGRNARVHRCCLAATR